jgi:hypothetical protein
LVVGSTSDARLKKKASSPLPTSSSLSASVRSSFAYAWNGPTSPTSSTSSTSSIGVKKPTAATTAVTAAKASSSVVAGGAAPAARSRSAKSDQTLITRDSRLKSQTLSDRSDMKEEEKSMRNDSATSNGSAAAAGAMAAPLPSDTYSLLISSQKVLHFTLHSHSPF